LYEKHGPEAAPSYSQKCGNDLQNENRKITENTYKKDNQEHYAETKRVESKMWNERNV
jgi:hypothetical protein